MTTLPTRQVHLDFHTSPHIPDVISEFDASAFAHTFHEAHVNSVTVFAKCHHGMSYYPTKVGQMHPALKGRDLLGEQIEALHKEGIRCPIYTTLAWEENVALKHPEWRQMRSDGTFARVHKPGGWRYNNWLHPDYQDYIEAHVLELLESYEVDGVFFDILMFASDCDWSEESLKFRKKKHLTKDNARNSALFESLAQEVFAQRFTDLVNSRFPKATVFYNSPNRGFIDSRIGLQVRARIQTHFEVESLPSGKWGYHHFPRVARQIASHAKPWLGMTARFQKSWGDFGGIKPLAALEYECFRTQALGGSCSVGDQLPPRGKLDPAAYNLIRSVYRSVEAAEPFYQDSEAFQQVGICQPNYPGHDETKGNISLEGAIQVCDELHYDAVVIDDESDMSKFELVVLPDSVVITPYLLKKLKKYYKDGGHLLVSYKGGFDQRGNYALDFLPLKFHGLTDRWPTYWRVTHNFMPEIGEGDRVFYQRGLNVEGGTGTHVGVQRVLPYFNRTDYQFCSHKQTPPESEADTYPAVVEGERFVYFSDPAFREYRKSGNITARDLLGKAIEKLIGRPPVGDKLPTSVLVVPRRRGEDLLVTLLHYIPQRKALEIDIIEDGMSFAGYSLRILKKTKYARLFPSGTPLKRGKMGTYALPSMRGRILIEVPGYF